MAERPRPLSVQVDLEHGGRWTSLRTPEREWLGRRPSVLAARAAVRPGDAFVDAGGIEECFPTVAGRWDHGDVWSRPWSGVPTEATVSVQGWALRRRMETGPSEADHGEAVAAGEPRQRVGPGLVVRYALTGPPLGGVLHAVHGLFALSESARVEVAQRPPMRVQDVSGDGSWTSGRWPGHGLDRCGPVDGSSRLAVVATDRVRLVDGPDVLELSWRIERGEGPVSLLLWRNLGGWPADGPYRSIGVEPLLGAATDLDGATPDQLARPDPGGRLAWTLQLRAGRR